jgi:cytochrome b561
MAVRAITGAAALLLMLAWAVGSTMEGFPRRVSRDLARQLHYSLGVLLLGAAALRVVWRAVSPLPAPFAVPGGRLWGEAHEVLGSCCSPPSPRMSSPRSGTNSR